jgi:hypothetical protein
VSTTTGERLVEPGKSSGVATMTIAVNTSARKKRLSIEWESLASARLVQGTGS